MTPDKDDVVKPGVHEIYEKQTRGSETIIFP